MVPSRFRDRVVPRPVQKLVLFHAGHEHCAGEPSAIQNALLFGEDATPMHKSKGNLVVFDDAAERVGSDTMHWLYMNHIPEQNLNFPRIPTPEDMQKSAET